MEKTKTKNLFWAGIIAIIMIIGAVFGLAACGKKNNNEPVAVELTAENLVGSWKVANIAYDAAPADEVISTCQNADDIEWTWDTYWAVHAKQQAGEVLTETEDYGYNEVFYQFFCYYEVTEDLDVWPTATWHQSATLGIENGELTYTDMMPGNDGWEFSAEWDNGKVQICITFPDGAGATLVGTMTMTLEKCDVELATAPHINGVWEITKFSRTPDGGEEQVYTKEQYLANEEIGMGEDGYNPTLHNDFSDLGLYLKIANMYSISYSNNPANDESWTPDWGRLYAYEDNTFEFEKRLGNWGDCTASYQNEKITLSATWTVENEVETFVWTLEKLAA